MSAFTNKLSKFALACWIHVMNKLAKKYKESYRTTNSENTDDGKFVVGYNSKNRTMLMISTYKNNCVLSFSPF